MKTTVEINDSLLTAAKKLAAERSTTLREIIEEGLRTVTEGKPVQPFVLRDGSRNTGGLVDPNMTWEEMMALCYEGRGA